MVDKAADYVPEVEKIVGDKFTVEVADLSGSVKVLKKDHLIFRIFHSMYAGQYVVRLDDRNHATLAKKVAEELGIGFVD